MKALVIINIIAILLLFAIIEIRSVNRWNEVADKKTEHFADFMYYDGLEIKVDNDGVNITDLKEQ